MGKHGKGGCATTVIAGLVAVATFGIVTACDAANTTDPSKAPAKVSGASAGATHSTKTTGLKASDVSLALKVTSKECFGTAGCNIMFRVTPTLKPGLNLPEMSMYDVTYDVKGGSDPMTQTIIVLDGKADADNQMIQTDSAKSVLKPVVVSVTRTQ